MSNDTDVSDLLLKWEEAQDRGQNLTPEELCRHCPELLPKLRRQISALQKMDPILGMSAKTSKSLVFGGDGGITQDIATILRQRLRLAGVIIIIGWTFSSAMAWLDEFFLAGFTHYDIIPMYVTIIITTGLVWPLFTRRDLSMRYLRLTELVIFGTFSLLIVWYEVSWLQKDWLDGLARPGQERKLSMLLIDSISSPWMFLIILYGTYIPNTWLRCARVVVVMALMPIVALILTTLFALPDAYQPFRPYLLSDVLLGLCMAVTLAVAIAIHGSYRIHTLQKQASEARKLGHYRLTKLLGKGGMGEVYLAEHQFLRRPCAIKLIRPERAGDARTLKRFEREVQAMATLTHWNTVEIYDYGHSEDGTFYYVMEYLPGMTLEQLVEQSGRLSPGRTVHLLRQTCAALHEAHAIGLIHRDIKPSNIIVCERGGVFDVVKLLDFGLVKTPDESRYTGHLTHEGVVPGTPTYMSPEQASESKSLDRRSDLSSLGSVAYFLLAGHPPFMKDSIMQLYAAHMYEPVPPLREECPGVPEDLERIVMRCLEKDPNKRYGEARDLERALGSCECANDWSQRQAEAWWRNYKEKFEQERRKASEASTTVTQSHHT